MVHSWGGGEGGVGGGCFSRERGAVVLAISRGILPLWVELQDAL